MRTLIRWATGLVLLLHGLIHVMGAVKGLGWADVAQLHEPIGTTAGVAWLVAAALVVATGVLVIARARWWAVAVVAAVVSQAVIVTSWGDAKAGTAANVLLLLAAAYGFRAHGPASFAAEFRRLTRGTLDSATGAAPGTGRLVGRAISRSCRLRSPSTSARPGLWVGPASRASGPTSAAASAAAPTSPG